LLADARSRHLLVTLSAYHILGHRHVRFPYYGERNIQLRKSLQALCDYSSEANGSLLTRINDESVVSYNLFNLAPIGLNMVLYTHAEMLYKFATAPQYVCSTGAGTIRASTADVVIDCGAALGDTALYFASSVGPAGRVLSIEPNPACIEVFKANLDLNLHIKPRIQLIQSAVGNKDDVITLLQNGPSSRISESGTLRVQSTMIDALVHTCSLKAVHFIKMDIEGAELNGLKGAAHTIKKHRPKLAICLYHKPDDFDSIPRFLNELDVGYDFYLEHHHMNDWETVLYATPH
jgi:FkbM family methyltransferase